MGTTNLKRRSVVEYCSRQRVIKEDDTDVIDAQSPISGPVFPFLSFCLSGYILAFCYPSY